MTIHEVVCHDVKCHVDNYGVVLVIAIIKCYIRPPLPVLWNMVILHNYFHNGIWSYIETQQTHTYSNAQCKHTHTLMHNANTHIL